MRSSHCTVFGAKTLLWPKSMVVANVDNVILFHVQCAFMCNAVTNAAFNWPANASDKTTFNEVINVTTSY